MQIIIGLGNPGFKFRKTRHNIGFMAVDALAKENNFPKFKLDKKSRAEISKGTIDGQEILLAKPQTYMNKSGFAVKTLNSKFKIQNSKFIVIHDDFDLPFGEVKLAENSGSGGHHGVESIIQALGTKNFKRIKVGIHPARNASPANICEVVAGSRSDAGGPINLKAEDFVLKKFTKDEEKLLASGDVIKSAINLLSL